jgi:hypothetical protein
VPTSFVLYEMVRVIVGSAQTPARSC